MDTFAAEIVLEMKAKYPWIILEMVSPHDNQTQSWPDEYKKRHDHLFAEADITTATAHEYDKGCMFRRNRYLVNNADLLLAAYDGQPGGTAMTIEYAHQNEIPVIRIPPDENRAKNVA